QEEPLLAVAADRGEEPRLCVPVHLARRASRGGGRGEHGGAYVADAAGAEVDRVGRQIGDAHAVALHPLARGQLDRRGAVEAGAEDRPLLVGAAIAAEENRLAVGRRLVERDALLRLEEALRWRVGPGRVGQVDLRKAVAVRDEDHLLSVAGEKRLRVQERVDQRLRFPGELRDARGIGASRRVGLLQGRLRGGCGCGARRVGSAALGASKGGGEEEKRETESVLDPHGDAPYCARPVETMSTAPNQGLLAVRA